MVHDLLERDVSKSESNNPHTPTFTQSTSFLPFPTLPPTSLPHPFLPSSPFLPPPPTHPPILTLPAVLLILRLSTQMARFTKPAHRVSLAVSVSV